MRGNHSRRNTSRQRLERRPAFLQPIRSAAVEALESRVLLSSDFLLFGNQVTTTTNGIPSTTTVPNVNNVVLTGDSGLNHFTIQNFAGTVSINGMGGGDVITVDAGDGVTVTVHDSAPTSLNPDTLAVNAPIGSQANVTLGPSQISVGSDTIHYDNTVSTIALTGDLTGNGDALAVNGSTPGGTVNLGASSITLDSGPTINYAAFTALTVNGGSNDIYNVTGDSIPTTINAGNGTVNVGSAAPQTAGIVDAIAAPLTILGTGQATVTVDDSGNASGKTATLTPSTITGISTGDIDYSGLTTLNLALASGDNVLTVAGTHANVTTHISSGAGDDVYNVLATSGTTTIDSGSGTNEIAVGNIAPLAGSTLSTIAGPLSITGGGSDDLTLDDSADTRATTSTLIATTLTGLSPAAINFLNVGTVTLNLGTAANTLTVPNTIAGDTTINSGTLTNTINLQADSGSTTINAATNDTVNIQSTSAPTAINTDPGSTDVINIGSLSPSAGGTLDAITGAIQIAGGDGADVVNLDDTASTAVKTGVLTDTDLSGLSPADISYSAVASLNVNLGSGNSTFNIAATSDVTAVAVNTGVGNDTVNVQSIASITEIVAGAGNDTVNVGSTAPGGNGVLDNIAAPFAFTATGTGTLNIDDSGSSVGKTVSIAPGFVNGAAANWIMYGGLSALNLSLGSGDNNVTVTDTASNCATSVRVGAGNNTVSIVTDSAPTTVNTGAGTNIVNIQGINGSTAINSAIGGTDTINVGSLAPAITGGNLIGMVGGLTVTGSGSDTLNLDDSADTNATLVTLASNRISGASPLPINFTKLANLNVNLDSAGNTLTLQNTAAGTATTVNTGAGNDTINVQATRSATTIVTGAGHDAVSVGSKAPAGNGNLIGLQGMLTLTGSGSDSLSLDNSAASTAHAGTLSASSLTLGPASINYGGFATVNLNLAGADSLTVSNTSAAAATTVNAPTNNTLTVIHNAGALTLNTNTGTNTINLQGSDAAVSAISHGTIGTNIYNLGSLSPAIGGTLDLLNGAITISGTGHDSLNLDDSASTLSKTGSLTPTAITGLAPAIAGIVYGGISQLAVNLGNGNDHFTIINTSAAQNTVTTGSGNSTFSITDDSAATTLSPGAGSNTIAITDTHGATTVNTGTGNDTVTLTDDHAATNINTGTGNVSVTIQNTHAPTTTTTGAGNDSITLTDDSAPTTINTGSGTDTVSIVNTHAPTTVLGGLGNDTISLANDSAAMSITTGGGTNTVAIANTNAATAVTTGSGNNSINVQATNASTTITGGTGNTTITAGSLAPASGGVMDFLAGGLMVQGGGQTTLTLDDTGSSAVKSVIVGNLGILGLSPQPIGYAGLTSLAINLGSGNNTVAIASTASGTSTTVTAGGGADAFSIAPTTGGIASVVAGGLALDGGAGVSTLIVDDSSNTTPTAVALTANSLNGIGYTRFATLNAKLSTTDTFTGTQISSTTSTTISGGILAANFAGNFVGTLNLVGNTPGGSIAVAGDFAGAITLDNNLANFTVGGNFAGSLAVTGSLGTLSVLGHSSGTVNVTGNVTNDSITGDSAGLTTVGANLANTSVGGRFAGTLNVGGSVTTDSITGDMAGATTIAGSLGTASVGGNFTGSLNVGANASKITIAGNITKSLGVEASLIPIIVRQPAGGLLTVGGTLTSLAIGGADQSAAITANAVGTITLAGGYADATGAVFSVTQGGVPRAVQAMALDGTPVLGATFAIAYDGATGPNPQADIRVTHPGTTPFNLTLIADAADAFDLSRLDAGSTAGTGAGEARNVVVDGSILANVTAPQAAYFGYPPTTAGGVQLLGDDLGVVSAADALHTYSIVASSIQGIAFASLVGASGPAIAATAIPRTVKGVTVLQTALGLNPRTHKPYARVVTPKQTLEVIVGTHSPTVGLFGGITPLNHFDSSGLLLSDQGKSAAPIIVLTNYLKSPTHPIVDQLTFEGDGGSVSTYLLINNITSTGPLGDVSLWAGKSEKLKSLNAPSFIGTINLHGGSLPGAVKHPRAGKGHKSH